MGAALASGLALSQWVGGELAGLAAAQGFPARTVTREKARAALADVEGAQQELTARLTAALARQGGSEDQLARSESALAAALAARDTATDDADAADALLRAALRKQDETTEELAAISAALKVAEAAKLTFQGDLQDARGIVQAHVDVFGGKRIFEPPGNGLVFARGNDNENIAESGDNTAIVLVHDPVFDFGDKPKVVHI